MPQEETILPRTVARRTSLLLCVIAVAGTAAAQDVTGAAQAGTPTPTAFGEELSVVARALASGAASVTVVDRETIEASNARTVAGLIRSVAGVQLIGHGTRGGRITATIRGGDPNFTLVLLDGIPLNNSTDTDGGAVDLSSLPAAHVERIEIVRGPHSHYFGSSAMAGAINIVSRRGESAEPAFEAGLEGGDASLLRADAAVSGVAGRGDYFVGVSWDEEAERVAEETFRQLDLRGSFALPLGGSALRLTTRYTDRRADDYPDASGGPVFGSGDLRSSDHRQGTVGLLWSSAAGGGWRHSLSGAADRQESAVSSPGVAPLVPPSVEETRYTRLRLGWLAAFQRSRHWRLAGGVDFEREEGRNDSALLLPPFLGGEVSGDYELTRATPGAFAELTAERGRFLVEAGLRADLPEDSATEWSPRLAVRCRFPGRGVLLRASWSRAFKLPSFFALASPRALGGNPELRTEGSAGVDLGVELESAGGALAAGLGVFRHRYEDLVDFDFDLFLHVNRSRVEAEGVELFVRFAPRPSLRSSFDVYWQQAEDPAAAQPLLNLPEWLASVRLDWDAAADLEMHLEGRYVDGSFDRQLPVPGRGSVAAYTVFDLAASWRFSPRFELRARVDNLADEDFENLIGFPAPGRSLRLGFEFRPSRP